MSNTIHIQIDRADGSLQRLIGLVERRGFEILGMNMSDTGDWRTLALDVVSRDGTRCINNLGLQIDRLFGVHRLETLITPDNV